MKSNIIIILGASHTGKTLFAQRLLEKYHYPYLSLDHLKMGLIRSGNTNISVGDDDKLTNYLWPIAKEMIKTAIENKQNLIVEGCYIPFDFLKDFSSDYKECISYFAFAFSEEYINAHLNEIKRHSNDIEERLEDSYSSKEWLIKENKKYIDGFIKNELHYLLINEDYKAELNKFLENL